MSRGIPMFFLALVATCASTVLASAQVTSSRTDASNRMQASTSPVAYVYVSHYVSSLKTNQINGYAVASNGSLTAIPGSPFPYDISSMSLNRAWLFGVLAGMGVDSGQVIDSFSIGSNGALTLKNQAHVNDSGGGVIHLFLDHTGSSLYADYYTTNNDYLSYSIDQSTGAITYLNTLSGGPENNSAASFIGNNQYAYSSSCYHFTADIFGVQRSSNRALSWLSINPPYPPAPSGEGYCPWLAAADPTDHLAIAVQPYSGYGNVAGPYQLATYTADSSGNLATRSTYWNMPKVAVGSVTDYRMSPDGKYLAVGGTSGLQIFHFNGANPITRYTGLLTNDRMDQMFWDNANHLYAISSTVGKLYVFTVTSTSVTQAPGSPHSIPSPVEIIVLPKT